MSARTFIGIIEAHISHLFIITQILNIIIFVGMMHFVRCWNKDVEVALIETFHSKKIVEKLKKAEEHRTFLVNVIKEQEIEISAMRGREENLANGRLWIDKNFEEISEISSTSFDN